MRVPVQTYVTASKCRSHSYSWQVDTFADFDQIFNVFHPDTVCKSFSGSTCLRRVSTTAAVTLAVLFTVGKEDEGVKGSNQAGWKHLCCGTNQKCTRRGEEKLLKTPGEMEDFGFHVSQVILNSNDQPGTRTGAPNPVPFGWTWSKEGGEHPALPMVSLEATPAGSQCQQAMRGSCLLLHKVTLRTTRQKRLPTAAGWEVVCTTEVLVELISSDDSYLNALWNGRNSSENLDLVHFLSIKGELVSCS